MAEPRAKLSAHLHCWCHSTERNRRHVFTDIMFPELHDYVLKGAAALTFNIHWGEETYGRIIESLSLEQITRNRSLCRKHTEYLHNLCNVLRICCSGVCSQLSPAEGGCSTASVMMGFNGTLTSLQSKALGSQGCHRHAHTRTTHTNMRGEAGGADTHTHTHTQSIQVVVGNRDEIFSYTNLQQSATKKFWIKNVFTILYWKHYS